LAALFLAGMAFAQTDPGVRGGSIDSGQPLASLASTPGGPQFFAASLANFQKVEQVQGGPDIGLGPRFNSVSCSSCHSQPDIGGTGPKADVFPFVGPNPQSTFAGTSTAPANTTPSFIHADGPTREARFPFFFNSNGTVNHNAPDGGVHDLFTIKGRTDAPGCNLTQPNFAQAIAANNIIFRIPTPVFGAGLIENIDDGTLRANQAAHAAAAASLGIHGTFNTNGNDGTITRFGWKAQNKSLLLFAGEAYNVEMGVTNEIFGQERPSPGEGSIPVSCQFNPLPEDTTNFLVTANSDQAAQNAQVPSDIVRFAMFMRLLAPPTASTTSPGGSASIGRGRALFGSVGCAICHTPSLKTSKSSFTDDLSEKNANLFSDVQIHHMGVGLADNVGQGGAGGDQFRSAPLWGLGQRIFLLHDGRTTDVLAAIEAHASNGSEANAVEANFDNLTTAQKQDVLNFLRSL
jgi:CxxC motif-containing protein (DUF1111 family)